MTRIPFEIYELSVFTKDNRALVNDVIRKKNVPYTPEEFVRQTVLHYLLYTQQISSSLIAVERALVVNQLKKRFDIVVYNRSGQALMLIECKSPQVNLDIDVLLQGRNYNTVVGANFLWLTNGKTNFVFDSYQSKILEEMPNLNTYL